jgi:hypothetical protein
MTTIPDLSDAAAGCMMEAPFGWSVFLGFLYTNRSRKETRELREMSGEPVSGWDSRSWEAWRETEGWKWSRKGSWGLCQHGTRRADEENVAHQIPETARIGVGVQRLSLLAVISALGGFGALRFNVHLGGGRGALFGCVNEMLLVVVLGLDEHPLETRCGVKQLIKSARPCRGRTGRKSTAPLTSPRRYSAPQMNGG